MALMKKPSAKLVSIASANAKVNKNAPSKSDKKARALKPSAKDRKEKEDGPTRENMIRSREPK